MPEKIVVGPVNKGLRSDVTPFNIDNDNFPALFNAYQWRGRVKRKRGTSLLCRLQRILGTTNGSGNITVTITPAPIGTGIISVVIGTEIFTDPGTTADPADQILLTNSLGATHKLNRVTGVLTITGSTPNTSVRYFPSLPVMGLEDFTITSNAFPGTIAFDTKYSYAIQNVFPYASYDVSFYKNPAADATTLPGYAPKGTWARTNWNGQDYQQFWTTNYQGALWATNGINIPFSITNIGMQYKAITAVTAIVAGPPAFANLTIAGHGLVVGDFLFINEVGGVTGINFQTGYVTVVVDANTVTVEFPFATLGGAYTSGGIAQYLTNRSDTTKDCIRWYDGDPTNGSSTLQTFAQGKGWVNFMPPLSQSNFSIADLPAAQYYLVGARMMVPFKDRLVFFGPVVQTSAAGSQVYLQDTIIYSQNGTPYYTASFTNISPAIDNPTLAGINFHPILVPVNQTATAPAWFEDSTGFGGFITAGVDQQITTVNSNEDVLLVGFEKIQSRLVYTGDDIIPFNFFLINSELGSGSTFSSISLDKSAYTIGSRGIIATSQVGTQRIDLEIPDQVFQFALANNGIERITAQRDFISEWIYFSYLDNMDNPDSYRFPNQTLQYNYRDNSWAIFDETYTTYGQFKRQSGLTWATLPAELTWETWDSPWNSSSNTLFQPIVIAGNQQGFVMIREQENTSEDTSLYIQAITGNTVTSPNHGLNNGDFIVISGALGAISTQINGKIFSIFNPTQNTFQLNPSITSTGTDYNGGAYIVRMYVPFIQSKQFPASWGNSRKTRIGAQQYLLSKTGNGQITLLIYLSQADVPYSGNGLLVNNQVTAPPNDSVIYSTVLYTCPESTNLGLTAPNINLQMVTGSQQNQIWHRMNTSLIGDSVQIGFTLSDAQMRDVNFDNQFEEIEIHGFILDVSPSMVLA